MKRLIVSTLSFAVLGAVVHACHSDPCVSVCERQRADGCIVIAVVQLPCSEQCEAAEQTFRECVPQSDAYYACADAQTDVCGEQLAEACAVENEALVACRTAQ